MLRETVNYEALATLSPGAELELKVEGGSLHAYDRQGRSVGALDPRLALRLLLMQGGNTYAAALISVARGSVRVVIRETHRPPGQANLASFVVESDAKAAHAETSGNPHPSMEEDANEAEEGDEDSTAASVPAEAEYLEAEPSEEERDPFANEAPRVQMGD